MSRYYTIKLKGLVKTYITSEIRSIASSKVMNILRKIINRPFLSQYKEYPKIRTLFTKESLGITAYEGSREFTLNQFILAEEFKDGFRKTIQQTVPLHTLTRDLKVYVHLVNSNKEDIDLLYRGLSIYATERERMKQNDKRYTFGPVTMRALSYLNLPDHAIKFFDDSDLTMLFDQLITYQILLDLLYESKMFDDLLRIYEEIQKRIIAKKLFVPKEISAIIFATYFRLNTPALDERAYNMYKKLKEGNDTKYNRRNIALVAAMRLRHNGPDQCLKLLSICDDKDLEIRFVRILSYTYLRHFDEVLRLLELTKSESSPYTKNMVTIPYDLLQKVKKELELHGNDDQVQKYQLMFTEFQRTNRIHNKKLQDVLLARFTTKKPPHKPPKL